MEFKVGDEVTVMSGGYGTSKPMRITRIKEITARKITLEGTNSESAFNNTGTRLWGYGNENHYFGPMMRHTRSGDREEIQWNHYLNACQKIDFNKLSLDKLKAISKIVSASE